MEAYEYREADNKKLLLFNGLFIGVFITDVGLYKPTKGTMQAYLQPNTSVQVVYNLRNRLFSYRPTGGPTCLYLGLRKLCTKSNRSL